MAEADSLHADRLARLRARLAELDLDGFYLPRTDPHGNEYLPPHEERVAWLTGFTGSFAVVVVLRDRAAIFTDGRYAIQVRQEVDAALYERLDVQATPPAGWIARHLAEGGRLGYDPYLLSRAGAERLARTLRRRRGRLVALEENPIDRLWENRPAPPVAPACWLPGHYSGEPSLQKRERIGQRIGELGAKWLVLTACDEIAWLLDLRGGDIPYNPLVLSYGLLHESGRMRWFVDAAKLPPQPPPPEVEIRPYEEFLEALDGLGREGAAVVADPSRVHVGFLQRLERAGALVLEEEDPVVLEKAKRNPVQIEGVRRAHRRDGAALVRFLHWLDSIPLDGSLNEADLARRLRAERERDPLFRGLAFETIVGHGPNAAIVHYRIPPQGARPITAGTVLLCDSGAHYLDGTTDVTRTIALGDPDAEVRERFTRVLEGHIALATLRFPRGTAGIALDAFARRALWEAGLDYEHGTGHGVGHYLCVHEGPQRIARTGSMVRLEPGMILSNEPGYYREGCYGIRIENLVLVREEGVPEGGEKELLGFETLTLAPIDRRLIDRERLSAAARAWLDDYHRRVFETLAPDLDAEPRAWLERACAPLEADV